MTTRSRPPRRATSLASSSSSAQSRARAGRPAARTAASRSTSSDARSSSSCRTIGAHCPPRVARMSAEASSLSRRGRLRSIRRTVPVYTEQHPRCLCRGQQAALSILYRPTGGQVPRVPLHALVELAHQLPLHGLGAHGHRARAARRADVGPAPRAVPLAHGAAAHGAVAGPAVDRPGEGVAPAWADGPALTLRRMPDVEGNDWLVRLGVHEVAAPADCGHADVADRSHCVSVPSRTGT